MATSEERYAHVVETYAAQQASIVSSLLRVLLQLWLPFTWWGRPDMVNAAAAASTVHVDAATRRARRMARAFMIQQLRLMEAEPPELPPIEDIYPRSGATIVEVYKRPARQLEHLIREKQKEVERETGDLIDWSEATTDEAMQSFEERLRSIVEDDIAAVARDEAQKVLWSSPKVVGYRRIIHPEFSKTGTCGLCVVASTRFYTLEELMPLHDKCKCTVSPITKTMDMGLKLNREDLDRIYAEGGSTYAEDLKRITVQISEHGELGPILHKRGTKFRDVNDVNRSSKRKTYQAFKQQTDADRERMWKAQRAASERGIEILEAAREAGTNLVDMSGSGRFVPVKDIDKAIEWHRSLIARATANLA